MSESQLKEKLESCQDMTFARSTFSIGHRGAPLQFPEHSEQSYRAAARMGAGIVECDVTFTKDKELVCRHAQNDLHTTTNILNSPLAEKCHKPFRTASDDQDATAECRTSDITLKEFLTLSAKMDAANKNAQTVEEYLNGTANWRTDLYANQGTLMTHKKSIALFKKLGVKFTPELKTPVVEMPFDGFSQQDYAQKLVDEYRDAGIDAGDVWLQSFNLEDILYWIKNEPGFGKQAVYLDGRYNDENFDHRNPGTWDHSMQELKSMGINYIAPPMWMLVELNDENKMIPSLYAKKANEAQLNIITWTLERSGPLNNGGGWYYQTIKPIVTSDAMVFNLLHVLASKVNIKGIFSDWPATTSYYANCMGIK